MSRVLTNEQYYYDIANTIRQMKNVNTTYKPRQMASALKDIYSNEVEGTLPLSFEANGNNLLDYRIDGASGGVGDRTSNLFDKNNPTMLTELYMSVTGLANVTSSYSRSIVIPCTPATTYSIKFKYETYTLRIASFSSYPTANKVGNDVNNVANKTPCNNASYTTSETANYLLIFCYNVATHESSNYSIDEFFSEIIVSESQIPLPYEPYGYKVPVVVSGKNIYDIESYPLTTGQLVYGNTGNTTVNRAFSATLDYIPISKYVGQTITLNKRPGGDNVGIAYYSENYDFISGTRNIGQVAGKPMKSTIPINAVYMRFTVPANETEIQIELGENSSSYEPYHEPTTTNIYLDNPIRTVEDEVEYIDYSEQKQHRVRKNLLQNTATTQTINGVNVIVNNDGSIKLSGTSTAITYIDINSNFNSTEFQDCYLNPFYPNNFVSSASTVLLRISNKTNRNSIQDFLNNSVIRDNGSNLRLAIRIGQNYTFSNDFVISPMISKFSDNTYEPYIENTEVDVTLPAIPTLDGTNTLSIGTTVQPSNMYIQAPKDSIEATQIANELEEI